MDFFDPHNEPAWPKSHGAAHKLKIAKTLHAFICKFSNSSNNLDKRPDFM
jgi:hypothetical protein